nr:MAG TPA: hypothetical protein [Caudoviricetes sp.]
MCFSLQIDFWCIFHLFSQRIIILCQKLLTLQVSLYEALNHISPKEHLLTGELLMPKNTSFLLQHPRILLTPQA